LLIVDAVHHQVAFFGEPGPDGLLPAEVVSERRERWRRFSCADDLGEDGTQENCNQCAV
jgi:hypothetical protein